jgi:hypothetical protein
MIYLLSHNNFWNRIAAFHKGLCWRFTVTVSGISTARVHFRLLLVLLLRSFEFSPESRLARERLLIVE